LLKNILTKRDVQSDVIKSLSGDNKSGIPILERYPLGNFFTNYMLFSNTPYWNRLNGTQSLFDWYHINPVFYAVVNIKAREYGNVRIKVMNRETGEVEPEFTRKPLPKKIYNFFKRPNVMQSRGEFFRQRKIFFEVAGNTFTYGWRTCKLCGTFGLRIFSSS
jgi:hypothetical protein